MQEEIITNEQAKQKLLDCKGNQFFTVTFIKKSDGSLRTMNCRKGVRKGVKGGGLRFDPVDKGLIGVWDRTKGLHRFISCGDIRRISIKGKRYVTLPFNKG